MSEIRLNLGCGKTKLKGFVNVDCEKGAGIDKVWDLNTFPYPWEEGSVSEIVMDNVLEHLDKPKRVIEELWRISADGARIRIMIPWHKKMTTLWVPEHKTEFAPEWFRTFDHRDEWHVSAYGRHGYSPKENFRIVSLRRKRRGERIFRKMPMVTRMLIYEIEVVMEAVKD